MQTLLSNFIRKCGVVLYLFSGWMYASSPAVSAMEHPVYDVWVIDCKPDMAPAEAGEGDTGG